jgi:tRNA nucleotidyltransferase/poly(A) polymerase
MKKYKNFLKKNKISIEIPLPNDVKNIAKAYHSNNKDLFVVGGACRDFIQGKIPHDYDLVTSATPEESKQILKNWNVSDEQGKNFGVLRVYTNETPEGHEIAVYRTDISLGRDVKGEDQKIKYGSNIGMIEDSKRRDLTINALYYDINKKEIIDLVGGIDDIKNSIIRSVGDPSERFSEDRLRILRCLRFTARTGGQMDFKTSQAIKKDNRLKGINKKEDVSQERIYEEWNKVIDHSKKDGIEIMQRYIDLLTEYNMWKQLFPNIKINTNIKIKFLSNAIIFFDLLNEDVNSKRKYFTKVLKFDNNLLNEIIFLQKFNDNFKSLENIYKLSNLKNRFHINDNLILNFVDGKFNKNLIKITKSFLKYCEDGFIIDGNELKKKGFKLAEIEKEKEKLEVERFKNEYL